MMHNTYNNRHTGGLDILNQRNHDLGYVKIQLHYHIDQDEYLVLINVIDLQEYNGNKNV